jgi:hypothetical protein
LKEKVTKKFKDNPIRSASRMLSGSGHPTETSLAIWKYFEFEVVENTEVLIMRLLHRHENSVNDDDPVATRNDGNEW